MKSPRKIVIAIDGPAASGKSTTAKLVARELGYLHVDTGAMYRAIALKVVEEKIPLDSEATIRSIAESASIRLESEDGKQNVFLNGRNVTREIRSPAVTKAVSRVSSYQSVRDVLVREQRAVASGGGVVLEGRDIGTVVLPHAELKIFMSANVAERARRRKKDLSDAGVDIGESDLVREIIERDRLDSSRTVSPLKKADDAVELDTSNLTIEEQVAYIVKRARSIIGT
ncbi:MAG TPA: (d)CMP kinase [Bacteroidota bacterium]|nr:(d)CMP kinase [Bacteroidota bacterium]